MPKKLERIRCGIRTWVGTDEKGVVLAGKDLLIFEFFSLLVQIPVWFRLKSMRKQLRNRMILPLSTSCMHASAFLVPEGSIAKFQPLFFNGIQVR
jgi:hypothetical protein